jgi:hypothetical protein
LTIITAKLCQSVITQFRRSVPKYWRRQQEPVGSIEDEHRMAVTRMCGPRYEPVGWPDHAQT